MSDYLPRPSPLPKKLFWILLGVGLVGISPLLSNLWGREMVNPGGLSQLWHFWRASLTPDLTPEFLQLVWDATFTTLAYAVCGTFLSVILGLIGGIFTSEVWWQVISGHNNQFSGIWLGIRAILAVPRAIHEIIWGLFLVNIFGLDPLVAILAITIPYSAIVAKVFSEILSSTPRQPLMALLDSGVAPLTAFLYGLLPKAFFNLLSYSFYRFECSLRSAAVLGIIGAGGLGYEMLLSLQSLRYEQLWTLFYALLLLNGAVDFGSAWMRNRLGLPSRLALYLQKISPHHHSPPRDFWLAGATILILSLIPICFWYIQVDVSKLWSPRTFELLVNLGQQSFPPDFSELPIPLLLHLSLQTLAMSLWAIVLAGFGGICLSFPAAANWIIPRESSGNWGIYLFSRSLFILSRGFLLICRAIPAPIWALVLLFVLFPSILPGVIALGIHNLGILGRLMAEVVENLDRKPLEALQAQGTPNGLVFLYGVLPAVSNSFLAYILYRWEVCLRETVIVGLVGAGGLGRLLLEQVSSFDYQSIIVTLSCLTMLIFAIDWLSGTMRQLLR